MWPYIIKVAVMAFVVVAVAEIAKRSPVWAALLVSLPLTSLLAFVWLYRDTGEPERVAALAQSIFWLVLPSLVRFVAVPLLLRAGWGFWASLGVSCAATAAAYPAMVCVLGGSALMCSPRAPDRIQPGMTSLFELHLAAIFAAAIQPDGPCIRKNLSIPHGAAS